MTPSPPGLAADERDTLVAAAGDMGLIGEDDAAELTPLTGGVSSLIVRVDAKGARFCVKQALEKLRVASDWRVSPSRSASEAGCARRLSPPRPRADLQLTKGGSHRIEEVALRKL